MARKTASSVKRERLAEISLYAPVKAFLEGQGYTVKGEIGRCDVVARRGEEPPVIVELKTGISLGLLLQGVHRLSLADTVYLAVPSPRGTSPVFDPRLHKLLRRLGLGLLLVHPPTPRGCLVEAILDPLPYRPRKNKRRVGRLLGEFARRVGDPNAGGSTMRAKLVTAYRQEALRIASVLRARGPTKVAVLRGDAEAPIAARILQQDVYGWFERIERGTYGLSPAGLQALIRFAGKFSMPTCLVDAPAQNGAPSE